MKKVGIVSCYFKHNYGSVLQAYATQAILNNLGIENETINIDENIDFSKGKKKYYLSQLFNIPFLKSKFGMIKFKVDKILKNDLRKNISIRDAKYKEFKKNFNLTKPYKTYVELTEKAKEYSSVIVGSDQLWLPVNVVADYYTLNWVPDDVNKISLATSFGISEIPNRYYKDYKRFLTRMDSISVREQSGVKIAGELSNKKVELICDPTMLLTKEDWMNIQPNERIIKDKYILCYFLGKNIQHRKFAEKLQAKTGYKIVSLNHADEYVKYSDIFADETPYDIGPGEWINLIRNAEYVCTDSFHGTVFSLINNVKFFTFERYKNASSKISTNSRIYDLLDLFGVSNRLFQGDEEVELIAEENIDFVKVNNILQRQRDIGRRYINKNIK